MWYTLCRPIPTPPQVNQARGETTHVGVVQKKKKKKNTENRPHHTVNILTNTSPPKHISFQSLIQWAKTLLQAYWQNIMVTTSEKKIIINKKNLSILVPETIQPGYFQH